MVTLKDLTQYATINNIDSTTDVFLILSKMQLEHKVTKPLVSSASKTEWTTQDVLDLFSS